MQALAQTGESGLSPSRGDSAVMRHLGTGRIEHCPEDAGFEVCRYATGQLGQLTYFVGVYRRARNLAHYEVVEDLITSVSYKASG